MIQITNNESFLELINAPDPVMIDFSADWCAPCHQMHPILQSIEEDGQTPLILAQIDIDTNTEAKAYANVMAVPTFVIYQEGKEIKRSAGARGRAAMLEFMAL